MGEGSVLPLLQREPASQPATQREGWLSSTANGRSLNRSVCVPVRLRAGRRLWGPRARRGSTRSEWVATPTQHYRGSRQAGRHRGLAQEVIFRFGMREGLLLLLLLMWDAEWVACWCCCWWQAVGVRVPGRGGRGHAA